MPGKFYMLVNPYIEGKTQKIFEADNSLIAAQQAYESVSKYFSNEVPEYHFSLLKLNNPAIPHIRFIKKFNLYRIVIC